jgi:hypothetical protein
VNSEYYGLHVRTNKRHSDPLAALRFHAQDGRRWIQELLHWWTKDWIIAEEGDTACWDMALKPINGPCASFRKPRPFRTVANAVQMPLDSHRRSRGHQRATDDQTAEEDTRLTAVCLGTFGSDLELLPFIRFQSPGFCQVFERLTNVLS